MRCFESHTSPLLSPPWTPPSSHHHLLLHLCCLHLCKKKYYIKLIFMYFLFNADLSKFGSQYYNIRYIHSLLLNSGPWTETIKTSTFNLKHKTEQGQSQASKKHLILSQYQCDLFLPVCHLPVCHLPHHYHTSVLSSGMKENRKNCVQNMSIIALVLAFQNTWSDIQN